MSNGSKVKLSSAFPTFGNEPQCHGPRTHASVSPPSGQSPEWPSRLSPSWASSESQAQFDAAQLATPQAQPALAQEARPLDPHHLSQLPPHPRCDLVEADQMLHPKLSAQRCCKCSEPLPRIGRQATRVLVFSALKRRRPRLKRDLRPTASSCLKVGALFLPQKPPGYS